MTADDLSPVQFGASFKAFLEAMTRVVAPAEGTLHERISEHLAADPAQLPVFSEEFDPYEHPNVQVAIDAYLADEGRDADLVGVVAQQRHYIDLGLSVIASQRVLPGMPPAVEGPVDYVNFHLAGDQLLPCVQFGLYFMRDGDAHFVVAVTGPSERRGPRVILKVEVMAAESGVAREFLAELGATMSRLNVYRGQVISLSPGSLGVGPQTLVAFHALPLVDRRDVVLPEPLLARVERQTFRFAEHSGELLAARRSLKRGLLLYGSPGTGKTLTLMYLIGRMPGRTVWLATGMGVGLLQAVVQMARTLAPAMVVIEDVDLIAEERGMPFGRGGALLFELLNELDGLRDDCDVIFALTTNRPKFWSRRWRPGRDVSIWPSNCRCRMPLTGGACWICSRKDWSAGMSMEWSHGQKAPAPPTSNSNEHKNETISLRWTSEEVAPRTWAADGELSFKAISFPSRCKHGVCNLWTH